MPILDIRAGSAAASNVNTASQSLIEALHARSKGISENIQGVGNHLIKYTALSDEMETNKSKRRNLDANSAYREEMNNILFKQGKNGGESLAEQQIQGAITAQNWDNKQKEYYLTRGQDGKSAFEKKVKAETDYTNANTSLTNARKTFTNQQTNQQALINAANYTDSIRLYESDPVALRILGTGLNGFNDNYDLEAFKTRGVLQTNEWKNGKLFTRTKTLLGTK